MADGDISLPFDMSTVLQTQIEQGTVKGVPETTVVETEQEKAAKVAAEATAKAAKEAADAAKAKGETKGDEESPEKIQAKLDELAKKDDKDLTEDDKKYIEKYTSENVDEITSIKQNFEKRFGIPIEGQFENNEEGLAQIAEVVTKVRAQAMLANYFENVPYMKDFYNHVIVEKRGIETFLEKNQTPAFKTIKLQSIADTNAEDVNNKILNDQKAIIKMDLSSKGMSEDDINSLVELYEDKGNLFDKAKEAYKGLETTHNSKVDAKLKAEEARIQAEQKAAEQEYQAMVSILDKNDFGGISIPATDIKLFKEAMLKPVDEEGRTIVDYKRAKLTLQQRGLLDYFVWKDFKISGLAPKQELSNKKFTFKKAAESNDSRNGGRTRGSGEGQIEKPGANLFDLKNIDFMNLREKQQ